MLSFAKDSISFSIPAWLAPPAFDLISLKHDSKSNSSASLSRLSSILRISLRLEADSECMPASSRRSSNSVCPCFEAPRAPYPLLGFPLVGLLEFFGGYYLIPLRYLDAEPVWPTTKGRAACFWSFSRCSESIYFIEWKLVPLWFIGSSSESPSLPPGPLALGDSCVTSPGLAEPFLDPTFPAFSWI